jgi:type II secretory ATPase GspE/PulE/Tfp pilus assembly ATPase PilB-like protein
MIKTILKNLFSGASELREINLKQKKEEAYENTRTRFVDKEQFDVYFEHFRKHPDYADMEDQEIKEKIVDTGDLGLFIGNSALHEEYIRRINKSYNKRYITSIEEFQQDFNLQDFVNLEIVENSRSLADTPDEFKKNRQELKRKYQLAKNHFMVPVRDKENKKILAVVKPTIFMSEFWYEDIVFIGPDIISGLFSVRGLDFLESNFEESDKTAKEVLEMMLEFMVDHEYSDLHYYLHDRSNYAIKARKNSNVEILTTKMNMLTSEKITEVLLGKMDEDRKTTKTKISKKVTHMTRAGMRTFRIEMLRQSKAGIGGAKIHRTVNIRLLSDVSFIRNFENLKMGEKAGSIMKKAVLTDSGGMYIAAGPTNSGKSTTLFALLYYLSKELTGKKNQETKVITIDKVKEYDIDGFIQYDLADTEDTNDVLTLSDAIHSILRQDPDIVSLGEARSKEDLQAAIDIGTRGHPTFLTVHTTSSEEVINLFENVGQIDRRFFASNIRMILHLELEGCLCEKCMGEGCAHCGGRGKIGKVPVFDLVYFPPNKIDPIKDDVYDFKKLQEEGKLFRITKAQRAKELFEAKLIDEATLNKYTGAAAMELTKEFSDEQISA